MVLKIMSRHWLLSFLVGLALSTVLLVHAQNQIGNFISIDCGTPKDFAYTERTTGINYISDENFTDTGVAYNISSEYNSGILEQPFLNVRSFPEGSRSCYTLNPYRVNTIKFLIRASFMYGNYDGLNKLPRFGLLLEADEWDTVQFKDASTIVYKEIIHVPKKNYIDVCLVNTGFGTPFISALELRPLRNRSYPTDPGISLLLFSRLDIGSMVNDKENFRLKDDVYDRIWSPYTKSNWVTISSPFNVVNPADYYFPPSTVMQTAAMPENGSNSLVIDWEPSDPTSEYYAYLYFAELDQSQADNETREEKVFFNGNLYIGPYTPSYLSSYSVYSTYSLSGQRLEFSFNKTKKSLLPPLVNALELYQLKKFQQLLTNQQDVDAIMNIKRKHGVKKNWQGDPCAPIKYLWQGVNCSDFESNPPRIISLNLSSSGISGDISPFISDLRSVQYLDLSNNSLTGPVPDFLLELPFLTLLNLSKNDLKGSVPVGLIEKQKNGLLSLSVDGNPDLFLQLLSNQEDVDAIMNIKATYGVKRNWQGDPCVPENFLWQGLNCSYPDYTSPRITSLNLSSSGISGEISHYISGLKSIQSLDLANNNLTGPVPNFLLQLPLLIVLNLRGNNLQGSVPAGLTEKQKNGLLSLSVDGNPNLCLSTSCTKKKTIAVPVLASLLAVSVIIIVAALSVLWILKTRSQGIIGNKNNRSSELKNRRLSYSDVVRITNNFERILGQGGFGTVYHGNLDDHTQVAVKMLSLSSIQGDKQFQIEVELLLRVHHKNLTTLVGYCDDGTNMGLVYEFMSNGNLESHLLDEGSSTADILSWGGRLRIATETAQGLEYLHSGCKPPIVHRDVKPTNILLNEKFQAKIADFGLSRIFPGESETHVSTIIAGTPGYLDPEYYKSNRLTEKSDVYSFGVVLLQIITSKPAIEKSEARTHIIEWVSFMIEKGDIKNVVDPRLQGDFDTNSVWRAVEVAMACVSQTSAKRPTMNQVVIDLNESLAIEIARTNVGRETESRSISLNLHSVLPPLAR